MSNYGDAQLRGFVKLMKYRGLHEFKWLFKQGVVKMFITRAVRLESFDCSHLPVATSEKYYLTTLIVFWVLFTGSFTFPASWHLMFGSPVHPQGNLF